MESSRKQTVMVFASANQFLSKDRIDEWSWIQGMSFAGATGVMNLATVTRLVESQRGSWLKFLWTLGSNLSTVSTRPTLVKKITPFGSDKISWTGWNEGWFVDILSGSITGIGNWEYSHQLTKFGHLELSWIQGVISWDQDTTGEQVDSQVDLFSGSVGTRKAEVPAAGGKKPLFASVNCKNERGIFGPSRRLVFQREKPMAFFWPTSAIFRSKI